jgi:hypothetical protein
MPASRQIVVSMDGYKTVTESITRAEFVEETRRMAATISVTLQKDGGAKPAETAPSAKTVTPPSAEVRIVAEKAVQPDPEPVPNEVKPEPEPTVLPRAVEDAPAPSETPAVDEP